MMTLVERFQAMVEKQKKGLPLTREDRVPLREALSTPDLAVLVREVVVEQLRDAAEPVYVVSRFFRRVNITEGRSIVFPQFSTIRVHEVAETQPFPEETIDANLLEAEFEVKVQKVGALIRVSDDMINESQWDVIGVLIQKAGEAMARHKEEKVFKEFTRHGHIVFDGSYVNSDGTLHPDAQPGGAKEGIAPTGLDINGKYNGTLSNEDVIDLFISMMANDKVPTDAIFNPLVFPIMLKNELIGSLSIAALNGPNNQLQIRPDQVQGRLPYAITVTLSPFAPLDRVNKIYDMFVADRNEVGVLVVKEDLTTDQWDNPERDIRTIRVRERYGIGILDNGRAIAIAKNIRFAKSYPPIDRVKLVTD